MGMITSPQKQHYTSFDTASAFIPNVPSSSISPITSEPPSLVQQAIPMLLVQKQDLDKEKDSLIQERAIILLRLAKLTNDSLSNFEKIKVKDLEIEQLRIENAALKERILVLENEVKTLGDKVKTLSHHNLNLNIKILDIESELKTFGIEREFNKFLTAMQDVNSHCQLERKATPILKKQIREMRSRRVAMSHFIDKEFDQPKIINYKIFSAISRLQKEMSEPCKKKFQEGFGDDFIERFVICCSDINSDCATALYDSERSKADKWWTW
jgi:chromosome segregation ATPase